MPDNYVDITVRANDKLAEADLQSLKDKINSLGRQVATAKVNLAGDKEAQLTLNRLDAKLLSWGRRAETANIKVDGAARAEADLLGVDLALDRLGKESETVGGGPGGVGGLAGLVSPMGALVVAAAALSPVVVTLGFGLAGFGAAAAGVLSPIAKAAQATGGLSKNLKSLPPDLQPAAHGLLDLGRQFHQFSDSMKPQVLAAFSGALRIAGHLMGDLQPVAKATGNAFDLLLGRVGAEFQSGTWQQFFGFMAKNAGPDMKLLGDNVVTLMDALPGLAESLQPVAADLLGVSNNALKVVDAFGKIPATLDHADTSAKKTGGALGGIEHGLIGVGKVLFDPGFGLSKLRGVLDGTGGAAQKAGKGVSGMGGSAETAAEKVQGLVQQVENLRTAETKSLGAALDYSNALITQRNDAHAFAKAMDTSHDKIGLNTQAQRNSFSAANTYIGDLVNTAQKARDSGHGVAAQARAIGNALPALEAAKTHSHAYWVELAQLKAIYDALQREQNITKTITINYRPGTVPGFTNPGPPLRAHSSALQGSAMITGSPGGLAASVMSSVAATSAAAFSGAMHRYAPKPYYGHEKITNAFHQAPGWGHAPGPPVVISNGAELIAVLAKLLSEYARTHHGGSAQGAYGYGPG